MTRWYIEVTVVLHLGSSIFHLLCFVSAPWAICQQPSDVVSGGINGVTPGRRRPYSSRAQIRDSSCCGSNEKPAFSVMLAHCIDGLDNCHWTATPNSRQSEAVFAPWYSCGGLLVSFQWCSHSLVDWPFDSTTNRSFFFCFVIVDAVGRLSTSAVVMRALRLFGMGRLRGE